jgi:hypothetical protein
MHHKVGGGKAGRDFMRGHKAGKHEPAVKTVSVYQVLESFPENAAADKQEPNPRKAAAYRTGRPDHISMPFKREQTGNLCNDNIIPAETELFPFFFSFFAGRSKPFDLHTAEYTFVQVFHSDARGKAFLFHGISHNEYAVRNPGCRFFSRYIESIDTSVLIRVERQAVYGMENARHPGKPCCEPAQDAGLGTVGMHNVGPICTKETVEPDKCSEVPHRMYRPPELGDDLHIKPFSPGALKQVPFWPDREPGDKFHGKTAIPVKPFNRVQGVFLRTPYNHPGDDVDYPDSFISHCLRASVFTGVHLRYFFGIQH